MKRSMSMAGLALAVLMLAPFGAQADEAADNEENCLRDPGYIVVFSGTDAGATRRGLNAGSAGCNTAGDPALPFVDTNYLTPGATHAIAGIFGLNATTHPGPGRWNFGDTTIELTWTYANDRWESQSIPMPSGTGTAHVTVDNYGVAHYQKLV